MSERIKFGKECAFFKWFKNYIDTIIIYNFEYSVIICFLCKHTFYGVNIYIFNRCFKLKMYLSTKSTGIYCL